MVQLKVNSYPYEEFGYIQGKLDYISNVATDSGFLWNVILPNGLTTVYSRKIQFRNGLQAQAVIITKRMRLMQRFYYNTIKKVNNLTLAVHEIITGFLFKAIERGTLLPHQVVFNH